MDKEGAHMDADRVAGVLGGIAAVIGRRPSWSGEGRGRRARLAVPTHRIVVLGDPPTDRPEARPGRPTPDRGCLAPARVRDYFSRCVCYTNVSPIW